MENEEKAVVSAYQLWKDNLISNEVFLETLKKMSGKEISVTTNTNTYGITAGQINYIKRLQKEGRLPLSQTLNLTKAEAQALISKALEQPIQPIQQQKEYEQPTDELDKFAY